MAAAADKLGLIRSQRIQVAIVAVIALLLVTGEAAAEVKGRIRRVGLFEGTTPCVRAGCTSFVQVELACTGAEVFEGELRVNQQDRDGDVVTSVADVGLTPDGNWHPKEVYFFPAGPANDNVLRVRLFDRNGSLVKMMSDTGEEVSELVSSQFVDLPGPDEFLIVDLTAPRKLPHVACLDTASGAPETLHARRVRALTPAELPLEWQGLEAVDAIVWDDADPSQVSERQIDALLNWVRHGGSLLLTSGSNWRLLAGSTLAQSLPVRITGVTDAREAQEFTRGIVKNEAYSVQLSRRYARDGISRCDMVRLPDAVSIPSDPRGLQPIAYRSLLGRGNLVFVGASLRSLLPTPPRTARILANDAGVSTAAREQFDEYRRMCERVIASNFLALPPPRESETNFLPIRSNLFDIVTSTISYKGLGFAFMMFAVLFAVAYVLTAGSSFYYLRRRDWQQHSWTAFGIVSLAGTVIGVAMVWSLRGVSTKVRQTTVIDAKAGEDQGYATCLFGVKTPDHTRLGLRLPSSGGAGATGLIELGLLRALPRSTSLESSESAFVASDVYRASSECRSLENVPIRATLKELGGRWHGPLGGTLDAKLVVPPGERDRFGEGSFIQNNLGVTLEGCIILEGSQEIAGEGGVVITRCLPLGTLPKSGGGSRLDGEAVRERLYFLPPNRDDPTAPPKAIAGDKLRLGEAIKDWRGKLGGLLATINSPGTAAQDVSLSAEQEYYSLLLLSVFNLIERGPGGRYELSRSHGRPLDCSHLITRDTAVLIGYSSEPAPAMLEINGVRRTPEKSITMYRFVIQVERSARSAGDGSSG